MPLADPLTAKKWTGNAQDIPRIYTLTFANTWATSDKVTLTCNNKSLTVTVGSAYATTDVAAAFNAAFNGSAVVGTESRNTTGPAIGEFYGCSSTVSGSVVTITGRAGKPLTCTAGESTAGTGTATLASVQAPTGKNWANNTANYSDSTVPVSGNTLVIKNTDVSILYDLNILTLLDQCDVYSSFTGRIGLPDINSQNASIPFREYSTVKATLKASAIWNIGVEDSGNGSPSIRLDLSNQGSDITVYKTASKASDVVAAVELDDGDAEVVWILQGDVHIQSPGDMDLYVGYKSVASGEVTVSVAGGTLDACEHKTGTIKLYDSAIATLNQEGGEVWINGTTTMTTGTIRGDARLVDTSKGTVTTFSMYDSAVLDLRRNTRTKAYTNPIEVYSNDVSILDPNKTITTLVVDCNGCSLPTIDRGSHNRLTYGTPA
jgi:hypothetical protein